MLLAVRENHGEALHESIFLVFFQQIIQQTAIDWLLYGDESLPGYVSWVMTFDDHPQ